MKIVTRKLSKTLKILLANLAIVYWKKNKIFYTSFYFQQLTFMVYQGLLNLELFRKPYKLKHKIKFLDFFKIKVLDFWTFTFNFMINVAAGPTCPTLCVNNMVCILLKPFLIHVKSYIKDNLDLLAKCSRQSKWDTIFWNINSVIF